MKVKFNADEVRKHLHKTNQSGDDFAYDADIKRETFKNVMQGRNNPNLTVAYKFAKHIKCSMEDLLIEIN